MISVHRQVRQSGKWIIAALIVMSEGCFSADEQQFGRLFTTPEQRQRLQELREEHRQTSGSRKGTETEIREMAARHHAEQSKAGISRGPDEPPVITLKGLIYRNDGARTAWIKAQDGTTMLDSRQLQTGELRDHETAIRVPVSGKSVKTQTGPVLAPGIRRRSQIWRISPRESCTSRPALSARGGAAGLHAGADCGLFLAAAVGPERARAGLSPARRQRSRAEPGKAGPVVIHDELSRPARQP